jgi:hypothetical protein
VTQICVPPDDCVRNGTYEEGTFRVPLSTLQRRKEEGVGPCYGEESGALFLYRMRTKIRRTGMITAEWLRKRNLISQYENPPFRDRLPAVLEYLRQYAVESAYVTPQGDTELHAAYKRRIYATMHSRCRASSGAQELRITWLWPQTDWQVVWKNLGEAW